MIRNVPRVAFKLLIALLLLYAQPLAASAESDAHGGGGGAGEAAADGAQFVELEAFNVTLYRNDAPAGVLTARLVLQLHADVDRTTIFAAGTKLRDALLRDLYMMAEREAGSGPKITLDSVKARMRKAALRTLGPDVVDDVLVLALLRHGA